MTEDLIIIGSIKTMDVFNSKETVDALLDEIRKEVECVTQDVSTEESRSEIRSAAFKIARSKTTLDKMGKSLTEEWVRKKQLVDSERKRIWSNLESLQAEVRQPLTDWEEAKAKYESERAARMLEMNALLESFVELTSGEWSQRLNKLDKLAEFDWGEHSINAADAIYQKNRPIILDRIERAKKHEAEQAELEILRKAEEERKAKELQERIEAEALEKAKRELEAKHQAEIERVRLEEEQKAQKEKERHEAELELMKMETEQQNNNIIPAVFVDGQCVNIIEPVEGGFEHIEVTTSIEDKPSLDIFYCELYSRVKGLDDFLVPNIEKFTPAMDKLLFAAREQLSKLLSYTLLYSKEYRNDVNLQKTMQQAIDYWGKD